MKKLMLLFMLCSSILIPSCHNSPKDKEKLQAVTGDTTKFKMFCAAFANQSAAPNYVVVLVKNTVSGETREVCTETQFLNVAFKMQTGGEMSLDYRSHKERYFEFSSDSALANINFGLYSAADLDEYAHTINVAGVVADVKSGKLTSKSFSEGYGKEQIMFAHLMFNNGVMVTRGCFIGNICGLSYFVDK